MKKNMSLSPEAVPEARPRVLRSTLTSPFGRKVRIAIDVLGLADDIAIQPADTRDDEDSLRTQNPLGKMPCLIMENGSVIYDSRVIIEYLDGWSGKHILLPSEPHERARVLTAATLADGIADAALLMVYEHRFREASQISPVWLSHQRGKVERGLDAMAGNPPDPEKTDLASISLACALGYLDWRQPVEWRPGWPALVAWLDCFASAEPAFNNTRRPEEVPA